MSSLETGMGLTEALELERAAIKQQKRKREDTGVGENINPNVRGREKKDSGKVLPDEEGGEWVVTAIFTLSDWEGTMKITST